MFGCVIPIETSLVIKHTYCSSYKCTYVHCPLTLGPQMVPVITASTTHMASTLSVCRVLTLQSSQDELSKHIVMTMSPPPGRHVDLVQVRRHGVHILLVLLHILAKLLEQLHRLLLRLGGLLPTLTILSLIYYLYK